MKVIMPKIGMSMQDALIVKWYRSDGDAIVEGEPMVYIETEKLTSVISAPATGRLYRLAAAGEIVACDVEIAEIVEERLR